MFAASLSLALHMQAFGSLDGICCLCRPVQWCSKLLPGRVEVKGTGGKVPDV